VSVGDKLRENLGLIGFWAYRYRSGGGVEHLVDAVEEHARIFEEKTGRDLHEGSMLEIGFGARPLRMMVLHGLGYDASGVDLETPIVDGGLSELVRVLRRHGLERALKSTVRSLVFDRRERRLLASRMAKLGAEPLLVPGRLIVRDASELDLAERSLDLIVSENVFEHIRPESLQRLVPKMARWLKPDGLALIQPGVYTGITGNHLAQWYPHRVVARKVTGRSEPWEHLRKRRFEANTYLNKLTRAEYRELFSETFTIEEERVLLPDLGRELLTPAVAAELSEWSDDELFSNLVMFVMRPRQAR